jgi:hypothetical protein
MTLCVMWQDTNVSEAQVGSIFKVKWTAKSLTVGRSVSQSVSQFIRPSWCRAPFHTHNHILICIQTVGVLFVMGRLLSREGIHVSIFGCLVVVSCHSLEDKSIRHSVHYRQDLLPVQAL